MADNAHTDEVQCARGLAGATVLVIGGTSGIGLAVARQAAAEGADVIVTGRDRERLDAAVAGLPGASGFAFDATDHDALTAFFDALPNEIDHVFVAAGGPYYALLPDIDLADAGRSLSAPVLLMIDLAQQAPAKMRVGGTLLFMSGTGARQPALGMTVIGAMIAATTAAMRNLALEIAPARINLIAAGFVDTPLSATLLGDSLDERRAELARELPVRRIVQPEDVAQLAVLLMVNTAVTGAVYDIDGGQQLL